MVPKASAWSFERLCWERGGTGFGAAAEFNSSFKRKWMQSPQIR